ncbi:PEP-CTERM sorting domain-containing protein [Paraglaciecola chathamensis]|uniref:PEP-CTERM sorting domain-containing protein n=1 Tax=Paraglaciecola chathamensis TaxID=368405 RepID=UPI002707C5BA|nr:PEP-CTERM sorting domain-containing protein [Paraglaciecola chathamensis]MDO6840467.1 PEP-CTERM sorting domain-containing protein [Paraglaciecola chathamensis]
MSIRKFGAAVALVVASLGFTSFSANAVLITQTLDLLDEQGDAIVSFGEITVEVNDSDIGTGLIDIEEYVSASIELMDIFDDPLNSFFAQIDASSFASLYAGLELIEFDLTLENLDVAALSYDAFLPGDTEYTVSVYDEDAGEAVFDPDTAFILLGEEFGLGQAQVVSAPASVAIFTLGLVAMGLRRRKN